MNPSDLLAPATAHEVVDFLDPASTSESTHLTFHLDIFLSPSGPEGRRQRIRRSEPTPTPPVQTMEKTRRGRCPCCHLSSTAIFYNRSSLRKLPDNIYPGPAEAEKAKEFLSQAQIKLNKLDSAIQRLALQRASVSAVVDKHQALLAPINRLSDDILYEIFLTLTISCPPPTWLSQTEYPWSLGLICKRWRNISLSYAPLWATVECNLIGAYPMAPDGHHIHHPQPPLYPLSPSCKQFKAKRLPLQLERSRGCDLFITVSFPDNHLQIPSQYLDIYKELTKSTNRWVIASLVGAFPPEDTVALLPPDRRFTQLEHLIVDNRLWLVGNTFQVAPKLKHVSLAMPSDSAIGSVSSHSLPWTQLTHLEINRISNPRRIFTILPYTANLTELTLRSDRRQKASNHQLQGPPMSRVELRHLVRLTIESTVRQASSYGTFFRYLYLPSLQHLDLGETIDSLPALLHDSKCNLKSLRARVSHEQFLVPTFAKLSHLQSLQLDGETQVCADMIVQDLTWSGGIDENGEEGAGARFLCPELTRISFNGFDVNADTLLDMVDSRCMVRDEGLPSPSRLKSVKARVRTADDMGRALQKLAPLRLDGLEITTSNLSPEWHGHGGGNGWPGDDGGWGGSTPTWIPAGNGDGWGMGGWGSD